jgi:hypothetical protein
MDRDGCIMSADSETTIIFQYEEEELEEADIAMLVPAIKLPGGDEGLTKVNYIAQNNNCEIIDTFCCVYLVTDQVSCKTWSVIPCQQRGVTFLKNMMFVDFWGPQEPCLMLTFIAALSMYLFLH